MNTNSNKKYVFKNRFAQIHFYKFTKEIIDQLLSYQLLQHRENRYNAA